MPDSAPPPPLYKQLAERLRRSIESGTLRSGEKLVSLRELTAQQKVSLATAIHAYRLLEEQGLIEARPQAGYFVVDSQLQLQEPGVTRPPAGPSSGSLADLSAEMFASLANPELIPLGTACLASDMFPVETIRRATGRILRQKAAMLAEYPFGAGIEDLRRQIGKRSLAMGASIPWRDILVTNGATEAITLCLRAVTQPGDIVVTESPTYFGILQGIEMLGLRVLEIPTDPRDGLSLDALKVALKRNKVKAMVLMPNAQNPLGSVMPDAAKRELAALAARHGIPVIEDDIYGDLYFGAARPRLLRAFDEAGMVLTCSSFSKSIAPGMRLGWAAGGKFHARVELLKRTTNVATDRLQQHVVAELMRSGVYERHLAAMRRVLSANLMAARRTILETFPTGTRVTNPAAGYVLWVEFPKRVDALRLAAEARAENISIGPGPLFSAAGEFRNCMRVSCGAKWTGTIERALARLGALATKH
jgi:DNA-binding transcriptional MocR family regulator